MFFTFGTRQSSHLAPGVRGRGRSEKRNESVEEGVPEEGVVVACFLLHGSCRRGARNHSIQLSLGREEVPFPWRGVSVRVATCRATFAIGCTALGQFFLLSLQRGLPIQHHLLSLFFAVDALLFLLCHAPLHLRQFRAAFGGPRGVGDTPVCFHPTAAIKHVLRANVGRCLPRFRRLIKHGVPKQHAEHMFHGRHLAHVPRTQ